MTVPAAPARTPSAIDALADEYLRRMAALDPFAATAMGVPGHDAEVTDYSPAGHDDRLELTRDTLTRLARLEPADDVDAVTVSAMTERLGLDVEFGDAGLDRATVNNIASPVQDAMQTFDLMPQATAADWEVIAQRLRGVPEAMAGYTASLRDAAARGTLPARRQLELAAAETASQADPATGYFTTLAAGAVGSGTTGSGTAGSGTTGSGTTGSGTLAAEVHTAALAAGAAFAQLSAVLRELVPSGRETDAVGRDTYALFSRAFLGATVDLDETYAWGQEELERIIAESEEVAERITGTRDGVEAARRHLDADERRLVHGTDALQAWMQETSDAAIDALTGTHFALDERMRRLECRIATTGAGGVYYTGPSEDFSRPGRMWWDVPKNVTTFSTWNETTVVYHEGVPGHHLQIATAVAQTQRLNSWRRLACWVSGHGEGWALYAERLMEELGFLEDDGNRLGMLDSQRMRAGRVVLDIGLHLGLPVPQRWGGGAWDYQRAWEFMAPNWGMEENQRRFELHRYLGWPGQAPSYKIGQRLWEDIRDDRRAALAEDFDPVAFHREALQLGSVGLDTLRATLLPGR